MAEAHKKLSRIRSVVCQVDGNFRLLFISLFIFRIVKQLKALLDRSWVRRFIYISFWPY